MIKKILRKAQKEKKIKKNLQLMKKLMDFVKLAMTVNLMRHKTDDDGGDDGDKQLPLIIEAKLS